MSSVQGIVRRPTIFLHYKLQYHLPKVILTSVLAKLLTFVPCHMLGEATTLTGHAGYEVAYAR